LLVDWFVTRYCKKYGKQIKTISQSILKALKGYSWPGNVRELENVIERAVINTQGRKLHLADAIEATGDRIETRDYDKTLEDTEREYILEICRKTRWRIEGPAGAARILGLKPSTLRSRLKKLGIQKPH
jgi:chemotaxis protein methyltransferase CheR